MATPSPCPSCGRGASADDVFCGGCGAQVRDPGQAATIVRAAGEPGEGEPCGSCNAPLGTAVSFCTSCGAPRRATDSGMMLAPTDDLMRRLEDATGGDYQILSHLGKGGMGSVFLALDPSLHRHVAIKVMAPALIQDATMQERFRTEARIVATLRHPGIVNIHGLRIVDDLYFFVMDYVEGDTVRAVIRAHGPLPVEVVRAVMYDVGSALQHAHSQAGGVIHRDVKPSNVVLDSRGHAVVMDFGISKAANARSGLTMTGMVVGTPEYMSPEQCRGGQVTAASDQYSLGLVGYAMLTGAPPFTGQHWSVLAQQTTADPAPIKDLRPDCPDEVAETIERMLAKSVRDRFPDVLTAVKAMGGKSHEHGAPVRKEIADLVERVGGSRAITPVVAVAIEGLPERAETGESVSITVTPLDGVGRALADRTYTLESTNPSVLEVVGLDTVRAVHAGSASIVARCETAEVSRPLLVTPPPVASLLISPPAQAIRVGDEISLQAQILDRRGESLAGRPVVWASSEPAVAEVSREGALVARGAGTTTIFATSEGQSTSFTLEVVADATAAAAPAAVAPPVAAPPVAVPTRQEPADPGTGRESAAPPGPAGPVPTVPEQVVAEAPAARAAASSERPASRRPPAPRTAEVRRSRRGLLAAVGGAVVAFAVFVYPGVPPFSGASDPQALMSLSLTQAGQPVGAALELVAGEEVDLDAELTDAEGEPVDAAVEWSSSDASIAEVDEGGRLVARASGTISLTAVAEGLERVLSVVVTERQLRLAVSDASTGGPAAAALDLVAGQSVSLGAAVLDASGPVEASIDWTSSNTSVADVDANGTVRATSGGSTTLTVSSGELRRTIDVSVRNVVASGPTPPPPPRVADLSIRRADTSGSVEGDLQLELGRSLLLLPQAIGDRGGTLTGISVTWSSSNPSVASISTDGLVTANAVGGARLTARAGDVTRDVQVEVPAPAPGTLVLTLRPWAYVTVDGERQGEDQRNLELTLPPGPHTLRLEHPSGTVDTTIVIESGVTTTINRRMTGGDGG